MTTPMKVRWFSGMGAVAIVASLCFGAAVSVSTPAEARVFIGFGFGFPIGFPYYYPPYPYPYYPPSYYPPLAYYPPPAYSSTSTPYQPSSAYAGQGQAATPSIVYTPRPGWTDPQGQYCREYKSMQGTGNGATERYGTACRDASGQWRMVN